MSYLSTRTWRCRSGGRGGRRPSRMGTGDCRGMAVTDQPIGAVVEPVSTSRGGPVPLEAAAGRLGYASTPWRLAARRFPVRWPAGYLALAEGPEGEPIRRMGAPDPAELVAD